MTNSNISVDRFSSQLLNYRGAELKVRVVSDQFSNTFSKSRGADVAAEASSVFLGNQGLVTGSVSGIEYESLRAYFIGRGTGTTNASTLSLLLIDTAKMIGSTPRKLLETLIPQGGKITFSNDVALTTNLLRPNGNQVGSVSNIDNSASIQYRNVRA